MSVCADTSVRFLDSSTYLTSSDPCQRGRIQELGPLQTSCLVVADQSDQLEMIGPLMVQKLVFGSERMHPDHVLGFCRLKQA